MQAQAVRTKQDVMTVHQSLTAVKTLISAGFGCILYLRGLLPEENFGKGYLTSEDSASGSTDSSGQRTSNHHVMTVKRGGTKEGDELLDYLDGVCDALERGYLRKFIFAVYLDKEAPKNIVEAYTFSFSYYTAPGSDAKVPIMSLDSCKELGDKFSGMSIDTTNGLKRAAEQRRPPTLGEVKMSVKKLIKSLILAVQGMESLPNHRLATFKLFYTDETPEDYEPPHFIPGHAENDHFVFKTHRMDEIPERVSVGKVITPHHGVHIDVASIAGYLPGPEDDTQPFTGISHQRQDVKGPLLTAAQEADARRAQIEAQQADALQRGVVWDAENPNAALPQSSQMDAEGELDPDYARDGTGGGSRAMPRTPTFSQLAREDVEMEYGDEIVPAHIGQLLAQQLDHQQSTQVLSSSPATQVLQLNPEATLTQQSPVGSVAMVLCQDSQEMLVMDTQPLAATLGPASGSSTTLSPCSDTPQPMATDQTSSPPSPAAPNPIKRTTVRRAQTMTAGEPTDCDCGVSLDNCGWCQCDGCGRWLHTWCMGYHSIDDPRLPESFACFTCRLQKHTGFALLDAQARTRMITTFNDLALFRRALKIVELHQPQSLAAFRKVIGCTATIGSGLWKRLISEEFIAIAESDDIGLLQTAKPKPTRGKKPKKAPPLKQRIYISRISDSAKAAFGSYFAADTETRLLGLNIFLSSAPFESNGKNRQTPNSEYSRSPDPGLPFPPTQPQNAVVDGRTHDSMQTPTQGEVVGGASKRKGSAQESDRNKKAKVGRSDGYVDNDRPAKKIKVSIVRAGVELDRY